MFNKTLAVLALSTLFTQAFAVSIPTCKIQTLKDAQACMNKVAAAYPEYEEPNDGVASANKAKLHKVLKALGNPKASSVGGADFVGLMLEHGDEHHLYYFTMKKGNAVKPVEVEDLNLVDLSIALSSKVTLSDLFLGTPTGMYDVEDDIVEALKDVK